MVLEIDQNTGIRLWRKIVDYLLRSYATEEILNQEVYDIEHIIHPVGSAEMKLVLKMEKAVKYGNLISPG